MRTEEQVELAARVTALEQLLEVGYANWMAQMTPAHSDEFRRQFEAQLRTIWPLAASEINAEVVRDAQGIAARFWKKVRTRERAIRETRGSLEH
jgi:hypothetical protein